MKASKAPIYQVATQIVMSFKEKGCTLADAVVELQKSHKQWKPTSLSPAFSYLVAVGIMRRVSEYGVKRYFVDKAPTEADWERLRKYATKTRANSLAKHSVAVDSHVGILIAIGKEHTETLTLDQARDLYLTLSKIFGKDSQ